MLQVTDRLVLQGITRRYANLLANDRIDLAVAPGEIHALVGENGAGKSTLIGILYGVLQADEGEIVWDGVPVRIADPRTARRLGIGVVFQHFSLFEAMTVADNIALALDRPPRGEALSGVIRQVGADYGLKLDPSRIVGSLSAGERQRVEIVRCLLQRPRLIAMDEPTSVLTPQEAAHLFETLRRLAAGGTSILYISHRLEEIRELCHRATVLRRGRVVAVCDPRQETAASLARMMVGADVGRPEIAPRGTPGPVLLALENVSLPSRGPNEVALTGIELSVAAGEIVGIAGIAGNGQDELMEAISGERTMAENGRVTLAGVACGRAGVAVRRRLGLATVPEDRLGHAALPGSTLADNTLLTGRERAGLARLGMLVASATRGFAQNIIDAFDVRQGRPATRAADLSGGNLQKFVVGREILQQPRVLAVAQPTWGLDPPAAAAIHRAIQECAQRGAAVLVIGQDLDELLRITDRVGVLTGGRLTPPRPTRELTREALGLLMGGAGRPSLAPADWPADCTAHAG